MHGSAFVRCLIDYHWRHRPSLFVAVCHKDFDLEPCAWGSLQHLCVLVNARHFTLEFELACDSQIDALSQHLALVWHLWWLLPWWLQNLLLLLLLLALVDHLTR